MADLAAKTSVYRAQVPAVSTAGNDASYAIKVTEAGVVSSVSYSPVAALSGANTNSRTLNLINKGQTGVASTSVASLALVSGTNLVAFDEIAVTLSGTANNLVVAAGDVLHFQSLHVGTGITDPGGEVEVVVTRTA
jgi:hypothetical protein